MTIKRVLFFAGVFFLFITSWTGSAIHHVATNMENGDIQAEFWDEMNFSEDITFTHIVDDEVVYSETVDMFDNHKNFEYEGNIEIGDIRSFDLDGNDDGFTLKLDAVDENGDPITVNVNLNDDDSTVNVTTSK